MGVAVVGVAIVGVVVGGVVVLFIGRGCVCVVATIVVLVPVVHV